MYVGLVATMMIGGLGHGASWTFVVWGALHGVGLVTVRCFESLHPAGARRPDKSKGDGELRRQAVAIFITFHFVCFTWIFFRAETIGQALAVLRQISSLTVDTANLTLPVLMVTALGFLAHWAPHRIWDMARGGLTRLPPPIHSLLLILLGTAFDLILIWP